MRKTFVAVVAALVMGWAVPSRAADIILFDPDGAGPIAPMEAVFFDWLPGNSLLVENVDGTAGTIYFQAALNSIEGTGGDSFDPQTECTAGACYFTAVAGFGVTIESTLVGNTAINVFTFDPDNTTNFLKIYADTADDYSDLAGTGFTDGTLILDALVTETGFSSIFSVANILAAPVNLDQSPDGNQYPGILTVAGTGGTDLQADVFYIDPSYFLSTLGIVNVILTNTSQVLPYSQTNPSALFSLDGLNGGATTTGVAGVGAINGVSTNKTVAQTDANSSFEVVQVVPEPASLLLLGSGLVGAAAARRRRSKKSE